MSEDTARLVLAVDSRSANEAKKSVDSLATSGERAEQTLGKMGKVMAGLSIAAGVGLAARQIYATNAEFQRLNTSLVTVTKSQDRANQVFDELSGFAARTPFQLREVTDAYILMRARGLDPTMETMTSLGNLASGMGRTFQDTISAVGSLAAGEIEPIKQLGFSVVTIGDKVRISSEGVSRTVSRNAYDISKAVASISDSKFAGGMERQINTLGGAWSNLQDQIDSTIYKMGQQGLNDSLVKSMQGVTQSINDATPAVAKFAGEAVSGSVEAIKWTVEHKNAVLALGAAYMTIKGGLALGGVINEFNSPRASGEGGLGTRIRGMSDYIQSLRMARIEELAYSENEVRGTTAALASAQAQRAKSAAMAVGNATGFEKAAVDRMIIAQEAQVAAATEAHTLSLAKQAAAQRANSTAAVAGSFAAKGFGAVVTALGGPIGATITLLATLAVVGPMAWDAMKSSAEKANEEADKYLTRLREEVSLLDRKKSLQSQGRTGEAGMDDGAIKALQAKEQYAGELQVKLAEATRLRERAENTGSARSEIERETAIREHLNQVLAEYNEIASKSLRIKEENNRKSAESKAASDADAKKVAENAKLEMEDQKRAQEKAKIVEERKTFLKGLSKDNAVGARQLASGLIGFEGEKTAEEIFKLEEEAKRLGVVGEKLNAVRERIRQIRAIADAEYAVNESKANLKIDEEERNAVNSNRGDIGKRKVDALWQSYEATAALRLEETALNQERERTDKLLRLGTVSEEEHGKRIGFLRVEMLRLKAEAGNTWAIIGYTVTQNAERASDALVDWMNNLDGVGHSWKTLGDTVRNVVADMLIQMEKAILKQQMMKAVNAAMDYDWSKFLGIGSGASGSTDGSGGVDWSNPDSMPSMANPGGVSSAIKAAPASPSAKGGSGTTINAPISITINGDGSSTVKGGDDSASMRKLAEMVGVMVRGIIVDESRVGGLMVGGR